MKRLIALAVLPTCLTACAAQQESDLFGQEVSIYTENATSTDLAFEFVENTLTVEKAPANPLVGGKTDHMVLKGAFPVLNSITYRYSGNGKVCEFSVGKIALGFNAKATSVGSSAADCVVVQAPASTGGTVTTKFKMQ